MGKSSSAAFFLLLLAAGDPSGATTVNWFKRKRVDSSLWDTLRDAGPTAAMGCVSGTFFIVELMLTVTVLLYRTAVGCATACRDPSCAAFALDGDGGCLTSSSLNPSVHVGTGAADTDVFVKQVPQGPIVCEDGWLASQASRKCFNSGPTECQMDDSTCPDMCANLRAGGSIIAEPRHPDDEVPARTLAAALSKWPYGGASVAADAGAVWRWGSDQAAVNQAWTNWGDGAGDDSVTNKCMAIHSTDGQWRQAPCYSSRFVLCQYSPDDE